MEYLAIQLCEVLETGNINVSVFVAGQSRNGTAVSEGSVSRWTNRQRI
jgi:hypothetical protein